MPFLNSFPDFSEAVDKVNVHMRRAVRTDSALLAEAIEDLDLSGGKKLRARIVLAVARALGGEPERATVAAACVELVHAASLLHDDVIDKAPLRRGKPSMNVRRGEDVAILVADLLYAEAFDYALSTLEPSVMRALCRACRRMCESEVRQIECRGRVPSEEEYLRIIDDKTAALFSACAEIGAVLGGGSPECLEALRRFGRAVGMAYQITDDALDYSPRSGEWGKEIGNDLRQGKLTLPLLYAFREASPEDRDFLAEQLADGRRIEKVLPVVEKYRGLEYAFGRARAFAEEAGALAPELGVGEAQDAFEALCRFVVERTY